MNDIFWWIGFFINILVGSICIYLVVKDKKKNNPPKIDFSNVKFDERLNDEETRRKMVQDIIQIFKKHGL